MSLLRQTLSCAALAALAACAAPAYRKDQDNVTASDGGDAGAFPLINGDGAVRGAQADASSDARATPPVTSTPPTQDARDAASMPLPPDVEIIEQDAGPRTPVVPAWAEPLRGPFASRAITFRQDEFDTVIRSTVFSLHEFALAEGGLQLRSKICLYRASQPLAEIHMVDPSQAPERVESVMFSETEPRWSTDGPAFQLGFTREAPAICEDKLGESVPKPATHKWTTSPTCRCADTAEEPLADDCRVLDPDGDGQPGFTFRLTGLGILAGSTYDLFGAIESSAHFANGQLRADGTLRANVRASEVNYQLGCYPNDCTNIAKLGRSCATTFNATDFVKLADGEPTCERILASLSQLFTTPEEPTPTRCFQ